jgi:hypothetical protein
MDTSHTALCSILGKKQHVAFALMITRIALRTRIEQATHDGTVEMRMRAEQCANREGARRLIHLPVINLLQSALYSRHQSVADCTVRSRSL